jgi:hypothetical protein
MVTFHDSNGQPADTPPPLEGGRKRPQFSSTTRCMALVVWVPQVRMVVVAAGIGDDAQPWHSFYAVIGIQTTILHRYRRRGDDRDPGGGHAELIEAGWRYTGEEVFSEPLIIIDGGVTTAGGSVRGCPGIQGR